MRKLGLALVSIVGLSVYGFAAMADAAPAAPAPADTSKASDLDKMVCRSMAPPTGSRLGVRRECRTQREWDDVRLQSEKELGKMQARDNLSPQGH